VPEPSPAKPLAARLRRAGRQAGFVLTRKTATVWSQFERDLEVARERLAPPPEPEPEPSPPPPPPPSLPELAAKHGTDKWGQHRYAQHY